MDRIFITPDEAINILPSCDGIHTFYNTGFGLVGADWDRESIIDEIKRSDYREITGPTARAMNHGLALFNKGACQSDVLFVETDMDKVNALYPAEDGET